jgi:type I restriction enzyme, S subunit
MSWKKVKLGEFLKVRDNRFKPNDKAIADLKRIDKIDFSGEIFISDKPSNTDMILIKKGDLVISGINVEKGAMAVYTGEEDITATIHYSSYSFDENNTDIEFLKCFLKSIEFKNALKEQVPGGIKTEIKPKHILPLVVEIPTDIKDQREVVKLLHNRNSKVNAIFAELTHQLTLVKKLRQQLLQDAVQGKLVEQNPNDEPASELLKKIKAEKEKLKKGNVLEPISEASISYSIPNNWIWCKFGEVTQMTRGKFSIRPRNDPSYFGGEYPFIQIGSLDEKGSVINEAKQTLNEKGIKVSKKFPKNTIAIAIVGGTIGNLGVLGREMYFTDSIIGILPNQFYNQEFILNYLRYKQPEIKSEAYQMAGQPNIKIPTLENLLFPMPPLKEQTRIVQKLDELMQYCNELEASIKQSQEQNEKLLQQVLREALRPVPLDGGREPVEG